MKLCDETITVFNAHWDEALQDEAYEGTVIRGASWYADLAETVDPGGGLTAANRVVVRIPADADAGGRRYVEATEYRPGAGEWTLRGGTIIVRGEASGDDWTPEALRARFGGGCVTVLGVTDNRGGPVTARRGAHLRIVGA